jgi:acetyl esterase/lipase
MRFTTVSAIVILSAGIIFAQDGGGILGEHRIRMYESSVEYHFYGDVPYLGEGREERMDIYSPVSTIAGLRPAVILIHGGGWSTGNKSDKRVLQAAEFFVTKGYVAISIEYKLTSYEGKPFKSKKLKGAWPQNIYDCKTAVRFAKECSEQLNVDKNRIIVMGFSAGGHLAMLTGYSSQSEQINSGGLYTEQSNDVHAIINFYGIPDVRKWGGAVFIDTPQKANPRQWALASPVEHADQDSPPILIVHGTADDTVSFKLSEEFVAILEKRKASHQFVPVNDGVHSFNLTPEQMDLRPVINDFLDKHLN